MNVRTEYNNLSKDKKAKCIELFKKAYGYKTHIDPLTNDFCFDFENWLSGNILDIKNM